MRGHDSASGAGDWCPELTRGTEGRELSAELSGAAGQPADRGLLPICLEAFSTNFITEVRRWVRTDDGLLTGMHQLARGDTSQGASATAHEVPFFKPASNLRRRSLLRIANPNPHPVHVTIEAWDSHDRAAQGSVAVRLNAEAAVFVSSQQLEAGDPDVFTRHFGDGAGKGRLRVSGNDLPLESHESAFDRLRAPRQPVTVRSSAPSGRAVHETHRTRHRCSHAHRMQRRQGR